MKRKIIRNVNDLIALLILIIVIPALWILQGMGKLSMSGEIIGATIMGWTLVLQYYFRKAPDDTPTTSTSTTTTTTDATTVSASKVTDVPEIKK